MHGVHACGVGVVWAGLPIARVVKFPVARVRKVPVARVKALPEPREERSGQQTKHELRICRKEQQAARHVDVETTAVRKKHWEARPDGGSVQNPCASPPPAN